MKVNNFNMLSAGPVTLDQDIEFAPIPLEHICNYAIQLVFTGTPDGDFKLQASNDEAPYNQPSLSQGQLNQYITHWTDIAGSTSLVTEAGDIMWTVENAGYSYVRVVWSHTASTGSLVSARCYVKGS